MTSSPEVNEKKQTFKPWLTYESWVYLILIAMNNEFISNLQYFSTNTIPDIDNHNNHTKTIVHSFLSHMSEIKILKKP